MKLTERFSVNNKYYKRNLTQYDSRYTKFQKEGPKGGILHSVGVGQPKAEFFAASWNKDSATVAVHAVIQEDGTGFQCLPWNFRGIHAGGEANNTHIGVEMTEHSSIKYTSGATFKTSDPDGARAHSEGCYWGAVELFAELAVRYSWNPYTDILGHAEAHKLGLASNHGDPEHMWKQLDMPYSMDTFRKHVAEAMAKIDPTVTVEPDESVYGIYTVDSYDGVLNLREGPSTKFNKIETMKNGQMVRCEDPGDWIYVKSPSGKSGWCHRKYLKKV